MAAIVPPGVPAPTSWSGLASAPWRHRHSSHAHKMHASAREAAEAHETVGRALCLRSRGQGSALSWQEVPSGFSNFAQLAPALLLFLNALCWSLITAQSFFNPQLPPASAACFAFLSSFPDILPLPLGTIGTVACSAGSMGAVRQRSYNSSSPAPAPSQHLVQAVCVCCVPRLCLSDSDSARPCTHCGPQRAYDCLPNPGSLR